MKAIVGAVIVLLAVPAVAQVSVNGYVRSDGTYVAPHVRSSPNSYQFDNYGARGNTNPYTGQRGTGPSEFYPTVPRSPSGTGYQPPRGYGNPYINHYGR